MVSETDIYIKDTNITQYHSYEHWNTKTALVCLLYDRAQQLFMTQVNYLKTIMSWNGYPHYIRTKINKQLQSNKKGNERTMTKIKRIYL